MIKKAPDLNWLPPREEWDFRSVRPEECRLACYWEYGREFRIGFGLPTARTLRQETTTGTVGEIWTPAQTEEKARPWLAMTAAERAKVIAAHPVLPAVQVRTLREAMNRMPMAVRNNPTSWQQFAQGAYVMRPNFVLHGVEAVIKELESWARREAEKYPRSPRAKAAQEPFHLLKQLATLRLEQQRRAAGLTYQTASQALHEYRKKNPLASLGDVFPGNYGSQGAWSKACKDAQKTGKQVAKDSAVLLRGSY